MLHEAQRQATWQTAFGLKIAYKESARTLLRSSHEVYDMASVPSLIRYISLLRK